MSDNLSLFNNKNFPTQKKASDIPEEKTRTIGFTQGSIRNLETVINYPKIKIKFHPNMTSMKFNKLKDQHQKKNSKH